jgi:hypothetical protein
MLRLFNPSTWQVVREVAALDVGWSIIDTDFSPDSVRISDSCVCGAPLIPVNAAVLCVLVMEQLCPSCVGCGRGARPPRAARLSVPPVVVVVVVVVVGLVPTAAGRPDNWGRFCMFSVKYSRSGQQLLGGSSDRCLYMFDVDTKTRSHRVRCLPAGERENGRKTERCGCRWRTRTTTTSTACAGWTARTLCWPPPPTTACARSACPLVTVPVAHPAPAVGRAHDGPRPQARRGVCRPLRRLDARVRTRRRPLHHHQQQGPGTRLPCS